MIPFKNRSLNPIQTVKVYRNLHAKDSSCKYSVMQNRLVIGHTDDLWLRDCRFIVSAFGRDRVLRDGRRNVHAFIEGFVFSGLVDSSSRVKIEYNPYYQSKFSIAGIYEEGAKFVHFSDSVWSVN